MDANGTDNLYTRLEPDGLIREWTRMDANGGKRMPTMQANGITINYEEHGSGEPLLLISGLGYSLWQWHRMVPLLTDHFRVILFDNRGAGGSDKPEGPYTVQMLAADTAGLLDGLGIRRATVLGHSMGGFVAQQLALSRPDLIGRLILAATNFGGPNHVPISPEAMQVLLDRTGDPRALVQRGIEIACAPGFAEAHPDVVQAIIAYRFTVPVPAAAYTAQLAVGIGLLSAEAAFEGRLHAITAPTLVVYGADDRVMPAGNAPLFQREIPHATVLIWPECGHMFSLEKPALAAETLITWCRENRLPPLS
jgi:pimeloyl-ACP methyl ester carboxylesterase